MGYTGIPSQGCLPCRQRRVKCDEQRPICQKCTKGRRACGGWRERWDLVFRDEGLKLARKDKSRVPIPNSTTESQTAGDNPDVQLAVRQQRWLPSRSASNYSIPLSLAIPLDDRALNFFTWAYTSIPSSQSPPSIPGYLGCFQVLYPNAEKGSLLQVTGDAVSLAALGQHLHNQDIIRKSQAQYIRAMQLTRLEIEQRKPPETEPILAILLLGLYEVS